MKPVLWEFRNDTDWSLSNGEFRHRLGPAVKEDRPAFLSALPASNTKVRNLFRRLHSPGKAQSELNTAPVTATVFVQRYAAEHLHVESARGRDHIAAASGAQRDQTRFAPSRRRRGGQRHRVHGVRPSRMGRKQE